MTAGSFRTLTVRLTIWYIVILSLLVFLSLTFLYQQFRTDLRKDMDDRLEEVAVRVNAEWQPRGVSWADAVTKAEEAFLAREPFIQIVRIDEHGAEPPAVIYRSPRVRAEAFLFGSEVYLRAEHNIREDFSFLTSSQPDLSSSPLRVVLFPVRGETIIQVGISMEGMAGELRRLTILMAVAGALLLVLASLGGSVIIRKALRPVTSVVQAARQISAEDLSLRIETAHRKDEIGELVATFNDMIARLDGSVRKIRRFSGDVSHELRTPLTIIRGEIEVLLRKPRREEEYRAVLGSTLEETHHMEKIIDDLLFLSRIEAADRKKLAAAVSLADVVERVRESRGATAREKGIDLEIKGTAAGRVHGERSMLERLVMNLVDNAVRYTPAGGRVEIELREAPPWSVLTIRDTGIGIPRDALPSIFDRFYVVDPSRSKESGGTGLGLSIVKSVAEIHGAQIDVRSDVGRGTVFEIKFPCA
jgi:two-component system OmpR family sensor kinase